MSRHAKAPSTGSSERRTRRRLGSLLATLALALCVLGSGASAASAATATMGTVTKVFSTTAHVTGDIGSPAGTTLWRFDVSTDGGENWTLPEGGLFTEYGSEPTTPTTVAADLRGLTPGTEYLIRFATVDLGNGGEETLSSSVSFTTAPAITTAPTVLATGNASELGITSAKVTGEVQRPGGANEDPALDAACHFEYITDAAYVANPVGERFLGGTPVTCSPNPVKAPGASSVEAILTGLSAETTYHLRLVASNVAGADSKESASTFTTQSATAPALALNLAANVKYTEAQISGTIDPQGGNVDLHQGTLPILWQLQYQLTSEPGNWQLGEAGTIEGEAAKSSGTPIAVGPAQLTSLAPGSEYKFRLVASYAGKQAISSEGSFETAAVTAPTVSELAVSEIHSTSAHFSGKVNPNGTDPAFNADWHFQCVPSCGQPGGTVGADGAAHVIGGDVGGLEPNTAYQVKLIASNLGGSDEDGPLGFSTAKVAPFVQTGFASNVESDAATVTGEVNPHNSAVDYRFEYGVDESYGTKIPVPDASLDPGQIDNVKHQVTQALPDLAEDTTYHFRLVATNTESDETTLGEDHTFTTQTAAGPRLCPNEQRRAENNSLPLPDCRAYEMVSPVKKNGFDAGVIKGSNIFYSHTTEGGDGVLYGVGGPQGKAARGLQNFAIGRRGEDGWSSEPAIVDHAPGRLPFFGRDELGILPASDLSSVVWSASGSYVPEYKESPEEIPGGTASAGIYRGFPTQDRIEWLTKPQIPNPSPPPNANPLGSMRVVGGSPDLSTVYLRTMQTLLPADAPRVSGSWGLYEYSHGELSSAGTLPGGSVDPLGALAASSTLESIDGANRETVSSEMFGNQVSRDGSTLFFVSGQATTGHLQLYVRRNGHSTLVSHGSDPDDPAPSGVFQNKPGVESGWPGRQFAFASPNGNTAVFWSVDALAPGAPASTSIVKAYRYDVQTNAVSYLPGVDDQVPGTIQNSIASMSDDGSRFLIGGAFAGGIKLWDHGTITTITSAAGLYLSQARTTPSGSIFVFVTNARIPGFNEGFSNQIYRYDVGHQQLTCVSCAPDGVTLSQATLANELDIGAPIATRGTSADLNRIFFQTLTPLLPEDVNGQLDVYEWTPSGLSLISSGHSPEGSFLLDNSASGNDVFFSTIEGLDPRDTDSSYDVYDARVGGGFAQVPPVADCNGNEVCKDAAAAAPTKPGPATNSFSGPGNPAPCPKGKVRKGSSCVKQKPKKHKHHKKHHRKNKRTAGHGRGGTK